MADLVLYVETPARAAKFRIAAAYAGVAVDVRVVDGSSAEASAVAAQTPFGRIPVLKTPQGCIGRSNAILRFIAGLRADAGLYGGGADAGGASLWAESLVDNLLDWAYGTLEPLLLVVGAGAGAAASVPGLTAEQLARAKEAALAKLPPVLAYLDAYLSPRTFLAAEHVTLADITVAAALAAGGAWDALQAAGLTKGLTNVQRWYTTCCAQPNFVAGLSAGGASASASAAGAAAAAASSSSSGSSGGYRMPQGSAETGWSSVVGTGVDSQIPERFRRHRQRIVDVLAAGEASAGQPVVVCGWARTIREGAAGSLAFIALHDGSCFATIQVVAEKGKTEGFEAIGKAGGTGSSFKVVGTVVKSPAAGQPIEVQAAAVTVLGTVAEPAKYPLAKKKHTMESLREVQHLRSRTNTFGAVTRIRNACAYATNKFFNERGFLYIHTPIITTSDCEGAGEMFQVSTIMPSDPKGDLPRGKDKSIDYKKDFFGKPAMMTVSGQLQVEAFSCSMCDVYTFGPTFRAENSHTSRHLAEFWMIEPEIAFATLEEDMALAEDYLKYCTQWVLDHCADDLAFFEQQFEKGLRDRLRNVVQEPFKRLTYTEAIELLTSPEHQAKGQFKEKVFWGCDLASEHERYITEQVFKKPVILINYPKDIKAFYMKLNPDGKTVAAMDVLVPKIGEIIGGSQREEDYAKLTARMKEMKVVEDPLWWYLELRKYGTVPHAGFGLGFERLVMYVTGIENIRDAIPFPRWPGNATF